MSRPAYALEWKNPRTGLGSLCEVEGGTIYELGTLGAMEASAADQNGQCHPDRPAFRPVPLPFAGELPDWFMADPVPEATVSQAKLSIDGDYGSEVFIRTITCSSFQGLRRSIRQMNVGRIAIDSPYDCTGYICYMSCKPIAIYRASGEIVAVVECHVGRDV